MDLEGVERFVAAAEEDYARRIAGYVQAVREEEKRAYWTREMRADVLAAHEVLLLARDERRIAERRAGETAACPRCGRVVGRALLFDSWARGVEWCADCDASAAQEAGR